MPVSVIHGVQERQRAYDADPQAYEARERQQKEDMLREEQERWEQFDSDGE